MIMFTIWVIYYYKRKKEKWDCWDKWISKTLNKDDLIYYLKHYKKYLWEKGE